QTTPRAAPRRLLSMKTALRAASAATQKRLAVIRARYCEDGFFEKTPADEVSSLQYEEAKLQADTDTLLEEWEEVSTALEAASPA
ncbi:MAG: hypothetical protein AAGA56_21795, partial [Myxococcota bacterium]